MLWFLHVKAKMGFLRVYKDVSLLRKQIFTGIFTNGGKGKKCGLVLILQMRKLWLRKRNDFSRSH